MRVALVHDDLVQWGGAERVLECLSEMFPEAPIYTSLFDNQNRVLLQRFGSKKIITSFLQRLPGWKQLYRQLLPLYPIAFEQFNFDQFDLVISQTTRFAKSIITKPQTKHICYCHTPPRFLWNFSALPITGLISTYLSFLRLYDRISSQRVDRWLAGSRNAQMRISQVYKKTAEVVYPFVDLKRFTRYKPFSGGYLLIVSRLVGYKRVDIAIEAANTLKVPLKIVGIGPDKKRLLSLAQDNVEFIDSVNDQTLTLLIAGCKALLICGVEDFGLMPLEANALEKPVVAFGRGGVLETVKDRINGYLFEEQSLESLTGALLRLDKFGYNKKACLENARHFSRHRFIRRIRSEVEKVI